MAEAKANKALPIGGGLWTRFALKTFVATPYTSWRFMRRPPACRIHAAGTRPRRATPSRLIGSRRETPRRPLVRSAVLQAASRFTWTRRPRRRGYNMMIIERSTTRSSEKSAPGKRRIEVTHDPQARRTRRSRYQSRWKGGRSHDGQATVPAAFYSQRDLRRRRGSRLAGVSQLFRPASVCLYR